MELWSILNQKHTTQASGSSVLVKFLNILFPYISSVPLPLSKDYPVVPRSTARQKAVSRGSPYKGDGQGLSSPEGLGAPFPCENGVNGSPQELLTSPLAPYGLPHPHQQAYHCTKRTGV